MQKTLLILLIISFSSFSLTLEDYLPNENMYICIYITLLNPNASQLHSTSVFSLESKRDGYTCYKYI